MSENITILLSESTTQEEKINAANTIIINYNLHLTSEEILTVFNKAMTEISCYSYERNRYKFLFEYLLNKNVDMFIAITKCCNDLEKKTKTFWELSRLVSFYEPYHVGNNHLCSHDITAYMYKNFLDYNNFNIDNLNMSNECSKVIEEYRDEKYGGRSTKAAKK